MQLWSSSGATHGYSLQPCPPSGSLVAPNSDLLFATPNKANAVLLDGPSCGFGNAKNLLPLFWVQHGHMHPLHWCQRVLLLGSSLMCVRLSVTWHCSHQGCVCESLSRETYLPVLDILGYITFLKAMMHGGANSINGGDSTFWLWFCGIFAYHIWRLVVTRNAVIMINSM